MNRFQAIMMDRQGTYFAAFDDVKNLWCVFGSISGYCYFTYDNIEQAQNMAWDLVLNDQIFNADCKARKPPPLPTKRDLALKKLRELGEKAGPLVSGMLAIGSDSPPKKSLLKKISGWFSKQA